MKGAHFCMVIRDICIKNTVVLPLTSLLLQVTQFQWTQYNLMCSLVSMMIFRSCDCAWSSSICPLPSCLSLMWKHVRTTHMARASQDSRGLQIMPQVCLFLSHSQMVVGWELCCATHPAGKQNKESPEAGRPQGRVCDRWVNEVGWDRKSLKTQHFSV